MGLFNFGGGNGNSNQANAAPKPQNQQPNQQQNSQASGGANNPENLNAQASGRSNNRTDANGVVPGSDSNGGTQNNQNNAAPQNPLDKFSDLFKNDPASSQANANQNNPFNVSQDKILEVARKTDFSKLLKPEYVKAITGDNAEGAAALTQMFNEFGQQVFAQAIGASIKISERTHGKAISDFQTSLPNHLKKYNLQNNLSGKNPVYNHPAVKPIVDIIVDSLVNTFAQKYPQASETELLDMAHNYMDTVGIGKNLSKQGEDDGIQSVGPGGRKIQKEQDFSNFLEDF